MSRRLGQETPDDAPDDTKKRNLRWLPLGITLFLSTVIVGAAFNPAPHTGGDNAAYVSLAYSLVVDGSYTEAFDPAGLPHTKYPPVFPGLLAVLVLLGARTWVALKLVTAASTVACVGCTYLWAERRLGTLAAMGVGMALAVSSAVVYYSHWILSDPLFVALTVAALWLLEWSEEEGAPRAALVGGVVAVGLAYFTRSAGLPLLVALVAWLVLRKKWKALGASTIALGIPVLLWWLRGRGEGVGDYGAELWMVDPYQPALGNVDAAGLVGRVVANAWGYVSLHGPAGILGVRDGGAVLLFGVVLTTLALAGWVRQARKGIGVTELFVPLYGGLILLWPEVWSGDRFALPLYPVFFLYAASMLRFLGGHLGSWGVRGLAVVAMAVVVLPAGKSWLSSVDQASACALATRANGPWACYGPGQQDFAAAATWIGEAAPDGSVVLSRKPRMFFVLSGVPSRVFPFSEDPAVHLAEADALGAGLVLFDRWDGLAGRYLGSALSRYPEAFCSVRTFGDPQAPTYLFGVRPATQRGASGGGGEEVRIGKCPDRTVIGALANADYSSSTSMRIPLLDGLDP
jgi:4-amino-4-deoxy-L-arabinose transferase-like glycosyltransferase